MEYQVTVMNKGAQFWLRGTTWAFNAERGNRFPTEQAAKDAALKAEKFMHHTIRKGYRVIEA